MVRDPERDPLFRGIVIAMLAVVAVAMIVVGLTRRGAAAAAAAGRNTTKGSAVSTTTGTYTPTTRNLVVVTVPLLVHEEKGTFEYLGKDFNTGVLKGKEVWGFSPDSLTVYAGDTVHVTVVNPSGDDHTFTLPSAGFNLYVKAQSTASGTFVARLGGASTFFCTIPEHTPYMWGQLVVLPDPAGTQG